MPGFYWGIYGEFFYLKISDTGMPTLGCELKCAQMFDQGEALVHFVEHAG